MVLCASISNKLDQYTSVPPCIMDYDSALLLHLPRACPCLQHSNHICAVQLLYVWDLDQSKRPGGEPEAKKARGAYPPQLLFTHAGHRASVSVETPHLWATLGRHATEGSIYIASAA